MTTGSSSVTLAIVDTGLGYINDFAGRVVSPYSAVTHTSNQADWNDTMGHGTACAGSPLPRETTATEWLERPGMSRSCLSLSAPPIQRGLRRLASMASCTR